MQCKLLGSCLNANSFMRFIIFNFNVFSTWGQLIWYFLSWCYKIFFRPDHRTIIQHFVFVVVVVVVIFDLSWAQQHSSSRESLAANVMTGGRGRWTGQSLGLWPLSDVTLSRLWQCSVSDNSGLTGALPEPVLHLATGTDNNSIVVDHSTIVVDNCCCYLEISAGNTVLTSLLQQPLLYPGWWVFLLVTLECGTVDSSDGVTTWAWHSPDIIRYSPAPWHPLLLPSSLRLKLFWNLTLIKIIQLCHNKLTSWNSIHLM